MTIKYIDDTRYISEEEAKRDPHQWRELASVRKERRAIVVGDGEDVGVEDASPREERPTPNLN